MKFLRGTDDILEWRDNVGVVLVTGCFDILHRGRVALFERAAGYKDRKGSIEVWAGLNSDRAVKQLKGASRPVNDYESRAVVIAGLAAVDHVFEIDDVRVAEAIRLVRPIIWVKGGDYTLDTLDKEEVKAANEVQADIELIPILGSYSTTGILRRLGLA